jgi:dienelactone hydrolase
MKTSRIQENEVTAASESCRTASLGVQFAMIRSALLWISFAIIMWVMVFGSEKAITPLEVTTDHMPDDYHITHWVLLGPFVPALKDKPRTISGDTPHDFLSDLGYSESSLTRADLIKLSTHHDIYKSYYAQSALLSLKDVYPETNISEVYAVAELSSKKEADIGIELGSQDDLTLWVNGQLVLSLPGGAYHVASAYDGYGIAKLHKGSNILIAKIDRKSDGGNIILNFGDVAHVSSIIQNKSSGRIVRTIFLHAGDPLSITIPPSCVQPSTIVEVQNNGGNILYSKTVPTEKLSAIELPTLPDGYYSMAASSQCGSITDGFYIGDPVTVYNHIVNLRNAKSPTSREYLTLDAIAQRYEILNAPAYYNNPSPRGWQMKLRMIIKDGVNAINDPNSLQWSRVPGLHLREYISEIDGAREPYLICVPNSYADSLPLIVTLPPVLGTGRPFLASAFLTSMNDLDGLKQAANEAHAIVIRYGNRGNLWDTPMADAQFFEVLSDVEREFNIDKKRIYLLGYSESGRRALLLAEHYPSLFGGVIVYGALIEAYTGSDSHAAWAQENNVATMINNLGNVATIIVNGDRDTEVSLDSAKDFYRKLVRGGVPASFRVYRYGVHVQTGSEIQIIPFVTEKSALPSTHVDYILPSLNHATDDWIQIESRKERQLPMKLKANIHGLDINIESSNIYSLCVDFTRLHYNVGQAVNVNWNGHRTTIHAGAGCVSLKNGDSASGDPASLDGINTISDGTLAEALSEPFLIVTGTDSSASDRADTKRDAFISKWKKEFFVTPRIKRDVDLTPDDIRQFNLVLIGKPANGSRLSVANVLAARVKSEVFSSPEVQQSAASIQEVFVLPNPLNVKRSLVYLDITTDLLNSQDFDPVLTGFYDYGFWDKTGQMLKSGIFEQREFNKVIIRLQEAAVAR